MKKSIIIHECKQCGKDIKTKSILCCGCGQFCSNYCQDCYHEENYTKDIKSLKERFR